MKGIYYLSNNHKKNIPKIQYATMAIEERVRKKLIKRYDHPLSYHDMKLIDDILYNEKSHFVGTFKEHLLFDDPNEFLRRFYNKFEIQIKLKKILIFYEKYSKIYANYTVIPEQKYMYKNIKRKQKVIDQMQGKSYDDTEEEEENEDKEFLDSRVFSTDAMKSIESFTMSLYNNTSNSKTKTDSGINELIDKLNNFENQAKLIKNNIKNDKSSRNYKINKKKQNIISGKALSNKIIASLITNSRTNMEKNNKKNSSNKISVESSTKVEKTNFQNNTSPKIIAKKIFSSPSSKIIKKKINCLSPSISINHSRKNSIIQKILSNSKGKKQPETERNLNYHSKIFSYKYHNFDKHLNLNLNKKMHNKQISSTHYTINSNYNNNNHEGLTSNNNINNNDLLAVFFLNKNNIFISPKSNNTNSNSSLNKNIPKNSINKSITKNNSTKFNLNLRKIILSNFVDSKSSSTDRKNIKKNFYEKIGKYFQKQSVNNGNIINSTIMNKISVKENTKILKSITKISKIKKKPNKERINLNNININCNNSNNNINNYNYNYNKNNNIKNKTIKSPNQSRCLSPNNSNSSQTNLRRVTSIHVNLGEKFKIHNFQNYNTINRNQEDTLLHSERLKKSKIIFK